MILKINVLLSQPRHMLWVLKRTISMSSAERSKAVVLLLLIHCCPLVCVLLGAGGISILVLVSFLFLAIISLGREGESWLLCFNYLLVLFDC